MGWDVYHSPEKRSVYSIESKGVRVKTVTKEELRIYMGLNNEDKGIEVQGKGVKETCGEMSTIRSVHSVD
jgi:hypothetical protein